MIEPIYSNTQISFHENHIGSFGKSFFSSLIYFIILNAVVVAAEVFR